MNCYTRYIIRNLLGPTIVITVTLTGIIWLIRSLSFLALIVNRGVGFLDFLYISFLTLPSLLLLILPVALFCGVLFTYNKLINESELIVLNGAGLSRLALAKPALIVAFGIMLFTYSIALYLLPTSYRAFKDTQSYIRNNYASVLLEEGVFNSPVKGLSVYIDERGENGMVRGILVHDGRDPSNPVTMMAEEGRLVQTPSGPRFDLINGNRQEIGRSNGQLSLLYFDQYTLDISLYAGSAEVNRWREPQERYINELFSPDSNLPDAFKSKLRAEGHQRLTWPLYTIALPLIALAFLLSGQFNRRGQWRRILSAVGISILLVTGTIGLVNLIAKYPMVIPLLYIVLLLPIGGSLYVLWPNSRALMSRLKA
ncbi:MAG: lptF [Rickettsiales bacterium]|jgi:lipopolysaccharide export system permease protein|nr:lptF [Rickettsiales bacterium]